MDTKTCLKDLTRIRTLLGNLALRPEALPVSFVYGGKAYRGLPQGCAAKSRILDANIVETVASARLDDRLTVRAEIQTYRDYGAAEWTLWFENDGSSDSAMLEDVLAIDMDFAGPNPTLLSCNGDYYSKDGYETTQTALNDGAVFAQAPNGGRCCNGAFPYQRLLMDGFGFNIAIGWPGQWSCRWTGVPGGAHMAAGQDVVHTVLRPGEKFRSPRMAVVAFEGDLARGVNVWRRWYMDHVLPRARGQLFPSFVQTADNGGGIEWTQATAPQQFRALEVQKKANVGEEVWWMDAGWYRCAMGKVNEWHKTGSWEPDPLRFPEGLRPIGDRCREYGLEYLLWFEPERVRPGTWLAENHPEWMLHKDWGDAFDPATENMLLDLSRPECVRWLSEHTLQVLEDSRVTIYRQDFNIDPLPYWRENEAGDRRGMIENLYNQGYLAYWDFLLLHRPDLMIDSCASGGRRNDLETMRRSVPLHQTDYGYGYHPVKLKFFQQLYGWIPYFRGFADSYDLPDGTYIPEGPRPENRPQFEEYDLFCSFAPMMSIHPATALAGRPEALELQREMVFLFKRVRHFFFRSDFYALTTLHDDPARWTAWQFHRPEADEGMVQFFRHNAAREDSLTVQLQALKPEMVYVFENARTGEKREMTGTKAMAGFTEALPNKRSASLWLYHAPKA